MLPHGTCWCGATSKPSSGLWGGRSGRYRGVQSAAGERKEISVRRSATLGASCNGRAAACRREAGGCRPKGRAASGRRAEAINCGHSPGRDRSQADTTRCCDVRCDVADRGPSGLGSSCYQSDNSCRTSADDDRQRAACGRPSRPAGVARNPHAGGNPYSSSCRDGPNGCARITASDIGGRRARAASRRRSSGAASANSEVFGKRCQRGSGASAQAVATWRLRCANTTGRLGARSIAVGQVSDRTD